MDKSKGDIAKDERIIILVDLIAYDRGIRATDRVEVVLAGISDAGGKTKEEPLNGNDINGIKSGVAINIRSR